MGCDRIRDSDCHVDSISAFTRFALNRKETVSQEDLTTPDAALLNCHQDARMLFCYSHTVRENALKELEESIE